MNGNEQEVASFQKTKTELVKVQLQTWRRQRYVDIRVWVADSTGEVRRSYKGLTLNVNLLPDLRAAVDLALKKLKDLSNSDQS